MNKITSDRSPEDDALVNFLQTYSSSPPPEQKPCEELLMRSIAQDNRQLNHDRYSAPNKSSKVFWFLPVALFSGFVMLSGHLFKQKLLPQVYAGYEDMETFMINTWQGSMAQEPDNEEFVYTVVSTEY